MIHENREEFVRALERAAKIKEFLLPLLEKDYYITLILSRIGGLTEDLVLKGGTCLSKVFYTYYRLSEDLDFSMRLPDCTVTRGERRKIIKPVKDNIERFAEQLGMKIEDTGNPGRDESRQYIYYFIYQSALRPMEARIKFEIGLRYNPIGKIEKRKVNHYFLHPFTGEPLFEGGMVNCLSLNELIAEKLRAAVTREIIAPRDFYDIDFVLRHGFDLADKKVIDLFKKKLEEDNKDTDLDKYRINLGRKDKEIRDMKSRIKEELFEVLTTSERNNFDIDQALIRINEAMSRGE